jgi:hypothetical protein
LVCSILAFFAGTARATAICDGAVHFVPVSGASCGDGSATGFEYACSTTPSAPLVIYLNGGGLCFDPDTCDCQPDSTGQCTNPNTLLDHKLHFDQADSDDGKPFGQTLLGGAVQSDGTNLAMFSGRTSPFGTGSNYVFVHYCTGDLGTGNGTSANYTTTQRHTIACAANADCPQGSSCSGGACTELTYTVSYNGYQNVKKFLNHGVSQLFPSPSSVTLFGESASGYGAECNLQQVHNTYPGSPAYEMNDAGCPFLPQYVPDFSLLPAIWGAYTTTGNGLLVGNTCPIDSPPAGTVYSLALISAHNAASMPTVRKTFTDDYTDATCSAFACILGAAVDPDGTCTTAWQSTLADYTAQLGAGYTVYEHTGTCHSERSFDGDSPLSCSYDRMVQAGTRFRDWVRGWMGLAGFSFANVL